MSAPPSNPTTADWRSNVQQSYRSKEANNIAKVLASLEPNATAQSKLMLASQFEQNMFSAASNLADYHKKINKRLKKMQKNYKANTTVNSAKLEEQQKDEVVQLQRTLKSLYGEKLELIVEKGRKTVEVYRDKNRDESEISRKRVETLMDHIDRVIRYAGEIGAVPPEKAILVRTGRPERIPRRSTQDLLSHLKLISKDMEKMVNTVRDYVIKFTNPHLFFAEKLDEMERNIVLNFGTIACKVFSEGIAGALKNGGVDVVKDVSAITLNSGSGGQGQEKDVTVKSIKDMMDKIRAVIPIPRSGNKEEEKETMLAHLNRMRLCCQVILDFSTLSPEDPNTKLQLAGTYRKAHEGFNESITALRHTYWEDRSKEDEGSPTILLEDAWNKCMDYDRVLNEANATDTGSGNSSNAINVAADDQSNQFVNRRRKRVVIRSKVLFTKHLPPKPLMEAMKRKKVIFHGEGRSTYLKLKFGEAFEMSVYFSPLLVSIRAIPQKEDRRKFETSDFKKNVVDCNLDAWTPPSFGLKSTPIPLATVPSGAKKRTATGQVKTKQTISVMGVSADVAHLIPIVASKLDYASAQATRCLRRCFAEHTHKCNSDYETEISEGNAVLKFLQLALETYEPEVEESSQ